MNWTHIWEVVCGMSLYHIILGIQTSFFKMIWKKYKKHKKNKNGIHTQHNRDPREVN